MPFGMAAWGHWSYFWRGGKEKEEVRGMAQRATGKWKGRRNGQGEALLSCRRDGSPVAVIVMRAWLAVGAWLAVAGVPPAAFASKRPCLPLPRLAKAGQGGLGAGNT